MKKLPEGKQAEPASTVALPPDQCAVVGYLTTGLPWIHPRGRPLPQQAGKGQ